MDRVDNDCYRALNYFVPMIDPRRDEIHGITFIPSYIKVDDIKEQFEKLVKNIGINEKKIKYFCQEYSGSFYTFVKNFVNFNPDGDYYDFIIFYNNPQKYSLVKQNSDTFKLSLSVLSNICFVNALYAEKKIVEEKVEEEVDRIIYPDTNVDYYPKA